QKHIYGVCQTAMKLAERYGADIEKARVAALFHDIYKGKGNAQINEKIQEYGLPKKYLDNANLAHGKIAAAIMQREYQIEDEDLLNGVSFHTTGRAGMSLLEKIVFIADSIEPGRTYEGVAELRALAEQDLDKACLCSLERTVAFVQQQGLKVDEDSNKAIAWLKKECLNE
ncbi:MAG: bis(5'-nucleosyl)-tetraphosphatase (symmetrical) YqeK, partial [Anaerovoracaceae bacterium]